ncbi:hypothetical protein GUA46_06890 [Muricauda sp. HICW]|uniref:DUF4738 domain-containing protein n=1 Tax=Flagellimonas chongwuensis TaxID=2697365 RepID=A0A850NGN3_9FLAO|nr:hypothetical protein [Allomuricauda chongwuensis]NVN18060.1 hypothetical protein [Allomuricauda chongwuensis]
MGNRTPKILVFLTIVLIIIACDSKSFDSKDELLAYVRDVENGYHFQKSINGIKYSLIYRPTDLMVSQFINNENSTDDIKKLRKEYSRYHYFNLSMSANGKELLSQNMGSRAEYGAKVNQFSFGMADKVLLTDQKRDTLELLDYVYPRMYGMAAGTEMLLVYESQEKTLQQDYLLFTIQDLGYGTGEVTFKIDTKKIKQQPRLNF